jgi:predicted permease
MVSRLRSLLRNLFKHRKAERELDEELRACLDILSAENEKTMTVREARHHALVALGGIEQVKMQVREVRMGAMIQSLLLDTRHVLRGLHRQPGFTVSVILTLALGIGANSAIFSLLDAVFINPVPVIKDPLSIVAIYTSDFSSTPFGASSYPDYIDMRDGLKNFSGVAAFTTGQLDLETTERLGAVTASANYFSVLGLNVQHGRFFLPDDESPTAESSVVISSALWSRHFQKNPNVIGRSMRLSDRAYRIIGVAPDGFRGTRLGVATDVWIPLVVTPSQQRRLQRGLFVVARLKAGASLQQAQSELSVLSDHLAQTFPQSNMGTLQAPDRPRPMTAVPINATVTGNPQGRQTISRLAALLATVVGIVLLIACANVASLLVARSTENGRDTAIRVAIGAATGRIVAPFVIESLALSLTGAIAGLFIAQWLKPIAFSVGAFAALGNVDVRVNPFVLGFTFLIATACGVILGIGSAFAAIRRNTAIALKGSAGKGRLRKLSAADVLVVSQVALSLVLLITAGLFIQSLNKSQDIDPGYRIAHGVIAPINLSRIASGADGGLRLYGQIQERLAGIVGTNAVALASILPLSNAGSRSFIAVKGYAPRPGEDMEINDNTVDAGYFKVMGIDIVAGRAFDSTDTMASKRVVIINEEMARRYWRDQNPIGQTVSRGNTTLEVIGVAKSGKYRQLHEADLPLFYLPLAQNFRLAMNLIVKTEADGGSMLPAIRTSLQAVDSRIPVFNLGSVEDYVSQMLAAERASVRLFSSFGGLAALLVFFGTYGVMRYLVQQRVRELGIRIALGARSRDVLYLVLRHSLILAISGVLAGAALSFTLSRSLTSLLYGVSPTNVRPYAIAIVIEILLLLLASYAPARRATRIDPLSALRLD